MGFFTAWGFTSEIPWDTPTWINLADRKIGAQANQLSHCVQTRQLDWADGSTFMQQMPDIVVAAAFLLHLWSSMQVRAVTQSDVGKAPWQWLFLRMCCMKACLGSVRTVPLGVLSWHSDSSKVHPWLEKLIWAKFCPLEMCTNPNSFFLVHLGLRMDRYFAMPFHNTSEREGKPTWQIITIPRSARHARQPQCGVRDEPSWGYNQL